MSSDTVISWHPKAVLHDSSGNHVTGTSDISANCDPQDPLNALPAYIAAMAAGMVPIMGEFSGNRPECIGDLLTQTGGSTGTPKTILRSSESWIKSFYYMRDHFDIGPDAHVAALGHLNHSLALYAGLEALHLGANFHALCGLKPHTYTAELHKRSITHLYATPTQIRLMPQNHIPSVTSVLIGGGMMDTANYAHAKSLFPNANIIEFYGAAETSFITISDDQTPKGSVGRAFENVTIDIRNTDGSPTQTGTIGEVWVKTPLAFKGYLPPSSPPLEFINVGEMGALDKNGYLFLSGRSDRAITIADQIVYLDQIETKITQDLHLQHIAFMPKQDTLRGYTLHALTNADDLSLTDFTSHLPRHIQPRSLTLVSDWPLLPSGKTDYKALEALLKGKTDD